MPKGKKKFIDRKSAITFHLVHRSQQDPLIADEAAPQHVLLPVTAAKRTKNWEHDKKRKEEQNKYGIFFDDDYNYLQHLRDVGQIAVDWEPAPRYNRQREDFPPLTGIHHEETNPTAKLQLPSSVFASGVEEDVGLLNKAVPHSGLCLDLDPDVVAAMDEDFEFDNPDNELEDNFLELANALDGDSEYESSDLGSDVPSHICSQNGSNEEREEEEDEVRSLNGSQFTFADEETKSRFTNYSMSSSVMRRNENLSLLDRCFEQLYIGYDDSEIGALDCEEIEGHVASDSAIVFQCADEFERSQATQRHETDRTLNILVNMCSDAEDNNLIDMEVTNKTGEKWDCESVLSTYSNLYNHPKLITEPVRPKRIRVSGRTGIPLGVLDGSTKLTTHALAKLNASTMDNNNKHNKAESVISTLSALSVRPKDETPDEKKERKKAVREYRKERRMERKANTHAFNEEKKRQEKVLLNNATNQQGIRIV